MANPTGKGGFGEPGHKANINRKGRPKSFDALRELAQQIGHEKALSQGQQVVINGRVVTVTEAILRQWAQSKNPQLQRAFLEIAYGKVPDKLDVTTAGEKIDILDASDIAEAIRILGSTNGCPGCGS